MISFVLFLWELTLNFALTASVAVLLHFALKKAPAKYAFLIWLPVVIRMFLPFSFSVRQSASAPQTITRFARASVYEAHPYGTQAFVNTDLNHVFTVIFAVWALGACIMLLACLIFYLAMARRLKTAVKAEGNVFETDAPGAPFTFGIFKSRIYLPFHLAESVKVCVLAHERAHIRYLDPLFKLVFFAGTALHWFNPLSHLAFILMKKDMERRADETAMEKDDTVKSLYPQALLTLSEKRADIFSCAFLGASPAKSRIKNALHFHKPRRIGILFTVFLSVVPMALTFAEANVNPASPAIPETVYAFESADAESPYRYLFSAKHLFLLNTEDGSALAISLSGWDSSAIPHDAWLSLFEEGEANPFDISKYESVSVLGLPNTDKTVLMRTDGNLLLLEMNDDRKIQRISALSKEKAFAELDMNAVFSLLGEDCPISSIVTQFDSQEDAFSLIGGADGPTAIIVNGDNAASVGIIGGADGPTTIFIAPAATPSEP